VNTSTVPSSLAPRKAVPRRGHGQLLDLLAERGDVLARLTQGGGQALVLGDGLGELALGLEDALLEGADPLGRVLEPQALHLVLEVTHLAFVLGEASLVLCRHDASLLPTAALGGTCRAPYPAPRHRFGFFLTTAG
jgi:hypothetical protein